MRSGATGDGRVLGHVSQNESGGPTRRCGERPGERVPVLDAVGPALAGGPPHRSVREELPHTALALDQRQTAISRWRMPASPIPCTPGTASGASKVWSTFSLAGSLPSTDSAAGTPALFARFAGTMNPVRLPSNVHVGRTAGGPSPTVPRRYPARKLLGSPGSRAVSFHACTGSSTPQRQKAARANVAFHVAFPSWEPGRHAEGLISELHGWPACTPVMATPATSRSPAYDSGPGRVASPFLYGSFIRNSCRFIPALSSR